MKRNTGPLGSGWRVVKRGDCLLSIAHQQGFFWRTLWELPENAELRDARQDPGQLVVGDRITIPERRLKTAFAGTDAQHKYVRIGSPAKLRVVVEYEDTPISNEDYVLVVNGVIRRGKTDSDGLVEVPIPPNASEGLLEVGGLRFELRLGALDPGSEDLGVQQRLANLGFYHGKLDGLIGPVTNQAVAAFQARIGLEATGELDDRTRDLLLHRHDELHELLHDETEPESGSDQESHSHE
jgi:hypothetical protein